ncbi:hypothetical protein V1387_01545 [Allomuricauda taeanensis]|uniref:hypothetical protein n=1 Tax=Flagellimonas taeanensis TaxID=1005926 RepID=UPI002E7AC140|nr:hypothetical protein [Allomuricauda taeanensis]MEE1961350.1 hypothetical protein [Allomuricauda taeanensis]
MKPILLILSAFLVFSCSKDTSKARLKSILREFQPSEQIFEIESEGSSLIIGNKGTRIDINTEDLVFDNGQKAEFPITISLLELITKEDLIRANAQTVSNGKWLVSGGAYGIKAFSDGRELKLKDGSTYNISFPKIKDAEMSIFYGERNVDGDMNWELSDIVLKEREYPLIILSDSSFMRYDQEYAIDMQVDTLIINKPEGKFSITELSKNYQQLDSISIVNDTVFGYFFGAEQVPLDSMALRSLELNNKVWEIQNQVYAAISLNKLGWINVDRFYPKIAERINMSFRIDKKVWNNQCFISSKTDNLILNEYFDYKGNLSFDFPVGKTFEIFVFGLEDDKLYGSRKEFRTTGEGRTIELKMKEINVEEIEDYLNLD